MDSARQALRWSIPGLIFVLELFAFAAVWQLAAGKNPLSVLDDISSTTALATLLAGIPIGFLLYQLYYRNYRPYGRSVLLFLRFPHQVKHGLVRARRFWSFVRRDRGAEILRQYFDLGGHPTFVRRSWGKSDAPATGDDEQIREVTEPRILLRSGRPSSFKVLTLRADANLHEPCTASAPADCGDCRKAYAHRFRWNWAIVMAMIDFAGSRTDGATIKHEYAAGSDIYHALGAARTAIASAAIGSVVFRIVFHVGQGLSWSWGGAGHLLLGGALIALLAYAQYQVIHSAREQSSRNHTIRIAAALCWYSRLPEICDGGAVAPTRSAG
jgi:hypothetical protein